MEMCKENCDTCIEDKSCCNGVYRTLEKQLLGWADSDDDCEI